jgi:hypothetical protein
MAVIDVGNKIHYSGKMSLTTSRDHGMGPFSGGDWWCLFNSESSTPLTDDTDRGLDVTQNGPFDQCWCGRPVEPLEVAEIDIMQAVLLYSSSAGPEIEARSTGEDITIGKKVRNPLW